MSLRFRDWPLRAKMAALLVAASLLPLAFQTYLDLRQTQARLLAGMKNLLEARGDQVVRELDAFHQGYQRSLDRLARFPATAAFCAATTEQARAAAQPDVFGTLAAYPVSDPGIRGAALLDASGRVAIATQPEVMGLKLGDRPAVRNALQGRAVISDPYVSPGATGAVPTIAYLTPVFDADKHVVCVAALWLRAAALWDKVKTSNALAGPGSFAVLFDREGIRIAHTYSDEMVFHPGGRLDPALVERLVAERRFGDRTRALLEDVRDFPEQFERARAASPDAGVFRGFASANQGWNYGVARRFQTVPWTVFYMVPEATFASEIAQATRARLLFAIAIITVAAIVGLMFATNILRPVRALDNAAAAIAAGDLSARVPAQRGDELGRLAGGFNTMAERIQAQSASLERSRDQLDDRVRERTAKLEEEIVERRRIEGELRERDAALRRAHEMAKLAHVITGQDGTFISWSETLPPLIGVANAQMPRTTREWMALLHPDDRQLFRGASISAGRTSLRSDVEYRLRRADGVLIHLRQVIEPIPGDTAAGRPTRWFSTLQDITEEKRAAVELRASEEHTRLVVESALDAVISIDSAGVISGWNPQAEATFGWTRAEAIGRVLAETIVPAHQRDAHRRGIERYLATGVGVVLNKRIELAALHRDGHEFPVDLAITPIRTGDTVTFSAFVRDITERKLAESKLRVQLERLQLLDQITRAIGERQDLQSIYQVAVRSLEDNLPVDFSCVCQYDPAEGESLQVIRVGAHSEQLAAELAMDAQARIEIDQNGLSRCVRGELVHEPDVQAVPFPFSQRLARGGLRSLVVAPLQSESRVFGVLVTARRAPHSFSSLDCEFIHQLSGHVALAARQAQLHHALLQAYDDLRQSQQTVMQQERLRALGQMASGIAHDINNAISPVALYTENLLEHERNLSERGREQLSTIARAIDDVAATVARMREFYRQREPQLTLLPVQLNSLVQQVTELTRARWSDMPQQRGVVITLQTQLAPDLPGIMGIESEVREALTNLIFNAVDAMPDGGVLVLRTRVTPPNDLGRRYALVEVADSGIGMDEETRRRCLEPFFTTKGERGTGLGLAMVYGMTQRHGADIEIDSAAGDGTTVRLRFLVPVTATVEVAPAPPEVPASRLRILLVDDDPLMLKSLREALELDGHLVVAANGGQAGIDTFAAADGQDAFDAVITDLGMPYVDGRSVASAVKNIAGHVPVILLTGWGQRLMFDGEVPANVDLVLSKPPKMKEVRAALAQLEVRAARFVRSSPPRDPA
ncbi:MAG TPA: PAS domain S-box protein [Burkholderiaceae bacterium]|nr:PAS domain S-box protein [Burkholderiaceae bacterium]